MVPVSPPSPSLVWQRFPARGGEQIVMFSVVYEFIKYVVYKKQKRIPTVLKKEKSLTPVIKGLFQQTPMGRFFLWRRRVYYNGYRIYTIAHIYIYRYK